VSISTEGPGEKQSMFTVDLLSGHLRDDVMAEAEAKHAEDLLDLARFRPGEAR
jgi:hypothetical protein